MASTLPTLGTSFPSVRGGATSVGVGETIVFLVEPLADGVGELGGFKSS